ncbi:hypothetical protein, partial [Micromonospora sp. AMSO1212t]|uniref:hypothetical protein n=1 Tax=Micromonospora sp. AMSO1212t TaxID=2650565 RepID=UPI001CECC73E
QHALRDLGAQGLVFRRVLQEVLDLVQFLDRLVRTRDVREGGLVEGASTPPVPTVDRKTESPLNVS